MTFHWTPDVKGLDLIYNLKIEMIVLFSGDVSNHGISNNKISDVIIIGIVIGVIGLLSVVHIGILINKRHLMKFQFFQNRSVSVSTNESTNGNSGHEKLKPTTASIKPGSEENFYYIVGN